MIKVYLGLPSTGMVVDGLIHRIKQLEVDYKDSVQLVWPTSLVQRKFHDYARNMVVEEFIESDCDVLWFVDSDVTPQPHLFDLLTVHYDKWEASGACYPIFMTPTKDEGPAIVFTAYTKIETGQLAPTRIPYSGEAFVDGLATGCLFLKRSIFNKISKPWFQFKFDPETRHMTVGEDLDFCMRLSNLGIKFFTDFSMVCRHRKEVDLFDLNNYAIEYANKAVEAYDAQIRTQVETLTRIAQSKVDQRRQLIKEPQSRLILP